MYQNHIELYFIGCEKELCALIRKEPLPEGFTCTYTESGQVEAALLGDADLILADVQALGADLLETLISKKHGGHAVSDELGLPVTESGLVLPCGAAGRWTR